MLPVIESWLLKRCSRPRVLLEPFAGGASASLFAVSTGLVDRAVLVEIDPDVAVVWQCILSPTVERLCRLIIDFEMGTDALQVAISKSGESAVDRAFAVLLRNRTRYGGILATGAGRLKEGENGKGLLSRWYPQTISDRIRCIHALRDRISIQIADGLSVMPLHNSNEVVCFVDPPYIGTRQSAGRRLYQHNDVPVDQVFAACNAFAGDFLLTHEDDALIREFAQTHKFQIRPVHMKARSHLRKRELLISKDMSWLDDCGDGKSGE